MSITVKELCDQLSLQYKGDGELLINSVASSENACNNQLTFLVNKKHIQAASQFDKKVAIITTDQFADSLNAGAILFAKDPQLTFAKAIELITPTKPIDKYVHPNAVISADATIHANTHIESGVVVCGDAKIGSGVKIGANSVVAQGCQIGENTIIDSNVTLYAKTIIGSNCRICSATVIGSPGFGIVKDKDKWISFPQLGQVIIGDDVDIGANCCIDRGALSNTIIGSGVKLDNLIQVAHNVKIGDNTVIAAFTGIAGSATIGKNCLIGGRVSIQGHINITDNVIISTVSFVNKSINKPGVYSSSIAVQENATWLKNHAVLHRLIKLVKRIKDIENHLKLNAK